MYQIPGTDVRIDAQPAAPTVLDHRYAVPTREPRRRNPLAPYFLGFAASRWCDVALAIVITVCALASAWCMSRAERAAERAEKAAQRIDGIGISHGE